LTRLSAAAAQLLLVRGPLPAIWLALVGIKRYSDFVLRIVALDVAGFEFGLTAFTYANGGYGRSFHDAQSALVHEE
jgi:hypothetical protein